MLDQGRQSLRIESLSTGWAECVGLRAKGRNQRNEAEIRWPHTGGDHGWMKMSSSSGLRKPSSCCISAWSLADADPSLASSPDFCVSKIETVEEHRR